MERILRSPATRQGWVLLALHLSRIAPPGPRAHHRRVAAAVLDDAAGRTSGQLFALVNGDMALVFRPADGGAHATATLGRLFQADVPDASLLHSLWALPAAAAAAIGYVRDRVTEGEGSAAPPELEASAGVISAMDSLVQSAPLQDLMHRQTAVLLRPGHGGRSVPLFREVAISTAVLEARLAAVGHAQADPFLFSHLAARLDHRMLGAMLRDLPGNGPLSGSLGDAALHLNLTLAGIQSEAFAALIGACRAAGERVRIGVELQLVEIVADPKAFVLARQRLHQAGMALAIDGLTHQALPLANLTPFDPDLVKLSWTPAMLGLPPHAAEQLREAIERLGPERVVLHRASSEAAIAWGLRQGITRFQGHAIDRLLAAERLQACASAPGCSLRQCSERASATGAAARAGCRNTVLLDLGAPLGVPTLSLAS